MPTIGPKKQRARTSRAFISRRKEESTKDLLIRILLALHRLNGIEIPIQIHSKSLKRVMVGRGRMLIWLKLRARLIPLEIIPAAKLGLEIIKEDGVRTFESRLALAYRYSPRGKKVSLKRDEYHLKIHAEGMKAYLVCDLIKGVMRTSPAALIGMVAREAGFGCERVDLFLAS